MAMLEIVTGGSAPRHYELLHRETIVGRHPQCDVVLMDSTVSRRHVRIYQQNDGYFIEDLGSQHGTLLNGERLELPERLHDRDQIRIRTVLLTYYDRSPERPKATGLFAEAEESSTILSSRSGVVDRAVIDQVNAALKLRALLEITHSLGVSLDVRQIFPKILESIFRIFPQASRGCILVAEGPEGRLVPHAVKHAGSAINSPSPVSRTIAERVMSRGEAVLSTDAGQDERFRASESVERLEIRSVMCAPLIGSAKEPLGMIQIDTSQPARRFTAADLDVLVNVANLAGQMVGHARLHETQLAFDRRQRDLNTAKQVQLHFLPRKRPSVHGYQLFDYYDAADEVGGDYYGYIPLPDGRLAVASGDVSGKGVAAALLMARLCSDVRYCLVTHPTPADAVESLNREIAALVPTGRFITFALCVLDPAQHNVILVNAGHMPPVVRRAATKMAEVIGLENSGPPLGVDAERSYGQTEIPLDVGDAILMYTDGISEAMNPQREMYGIERIAEVAAAPKSAESIVQTLVGDVKQFARGSSPKDDRCVVCILREV